MGGCCCSCRNARLQGAPVYYYCQPTLEEQRPFASYNSPVHSFPSGFFVGLNLDTSIPDTYRPPPAPIPFSVLFGSKPASETEVAARLGTSNTKTLADILLASPTKSERENLKTSQQVYEIEEEDCCPICLEEYDAENPKWVTKCEHRFHLSCILEWLERSDSCPVCDKEITLERASDRVAGKSK